jgi:hypothetical protein
VDDALQAATKERINALVVMRAASVDRHLKRIVDFAMKNRLPSVWEVSSWRVVV